MSGLRYNSGRTTAVGQGTTVDKGKLNASLYEGSIIYHTDNQLYFSNGSMWVLVQPANVQFSFTGNNALFMNGKQEIQLSVNSSIYATNAQFAFTANNARFAYGKQEAQLSVNAATFAVNSVSAAQATLANNSTYAYGKQEAQLAVNTAVTANNSTYAYGKQESQLAVNTAILANNSTFAYGKQESQLSVSSANNSSYLEGRTWASPKDIGTSVSSNGIFTNVTVLNNLVVNGTMTVVNTSITTTNNTFIILNEGQDTPVNDVGLIFQRYSNPSETNYNITAFWEETSKKFIIGKASIPIAQDSANLDNVFSLFDISESGTVTINGQLVANQAVTNQLTVNTVVANGSFGTARQFLTANGTGGTYWYTLDPSLPIAKDNTSTVKYYLPMSNAVSGTWSNAVIADERLSFTPSTGTLTANQGAFTNALVSGNTYISKLVANGSIGGAGQVLLSNGAGIYWENSLTIAPRAGYGLSSNATHYQVNANSGIIANNNGTFVNAAYIATISANNTTYVNGKAEGQLSVNNSVYLNSKSEAQLNVNAAVFATNAQFAYTSNSSNYLAGRTWGAPAVIGNDVSNAAFFSNTTTNRAQIGVLTANGSVGSFGQILASNGSGLYWTSNPPGIAIPLTQNNNSTSTWYFPMSNSATGSWSNAAVADAKLSFVPSTGTLNVSTANVGKAVIANAVITAILANGSFGGVNQVLTSNGSSIYWTGDTNTMYDLIGVSNTIQNVGILRLVSSANANDDVLFVGGGTTVVSSNSTHIVFSTQDQFKGTVTSITSGNGLVGSPITSSGTLAVGSGAGISVNVDDVAVNAKDGLTANASGLWVNNDFIRALSTISQVNNAIYLNGKTESQLNANSALYANNSNFLGGKSASYWTTVALGNTTADYSWSGAHTFLRSIYMGNNTSSYIKWNDRGLQAPVAGQSWGDGTRIALWDKFGPNDVGFGIGMEPGAIWYSANNTSSSHKWYANTNNIMVANTTGLFVNGTIYGTATTTVTNANNSTYAYGKQESQLSVANAVYSQSSNNASRLGGKLEANLSVNNAIYLNGKSESQLDVANAAFALVANSVLGSIALANNATYAYGRQQSQLNANSAVYLNGKQESQLYVANAVFATVANSVLGSIALANNATYAYGKQESQLVVANAAFATVANSVLGAIALANNSTYAFGKQESQLSVNSATIATSALSANTAKVANNSTYAYGKQESQLSVAYADAANNAAYAYGKQEFQLTVGTANNSTYAYGKQESQLDVDKLDGQHGSYYADIPARLGFTPVQQGTGTGQSNTNVIKIGWSNSVNGAASLRLMVDGVDYGNTWPIAITGSGGGGGSADTANNATYAYGKQESQLSVATANNVTYAYGRQQSQLSVNNAVYFNGTSTTEYARRDGSTFTGTITSTVGGTAINLNNGTSNRIVWNQNGVAAPSFASYSNGTKLVLYDNNNGTNLAGYAIGIETSNMWFGTDATSSGFKWYGGTTNYMTANTTALYHTNDIIATGDMLAGGNVTGYSDIKIKENIELISDALNKVSQIRGVTFNRIDLDNDKRYTGVIAQEVEKVLPEAVQDNSDGLKSVAYGNMVGLLIEAIKELKLIVEDQQKQIDELKSK